MKLGSYPRTAIKAFVLMATTFGIAISKPQGEPLPSLTKEIAKQLVAGRGDDDLWEKMIHLITTNTTACRLEGKIKEIKNALHEKSRFLRSWKEEGDLTTT